MMSTHRSRQTLLQRFCFACLALSLVACATRTVNPRIDESINHGDPFGLLGQEAHDKKTIAVLAFSGGERDLSNSKAVKSMSEVTDWTVLRDLSQNHFYIRTINSLNFSKFDVNKLSVLKETKVVSMKALDANTSLDANDLFLK